MTQYQEYKEPSNFLEIRNFEVIEFTQETDYDFIEVVSYKIIILLATLKCFKIREGFI